MRRRKWWLPMAVMLALLAWWTAVGLQKQILIANDGNFLISDAVWNVGDKVFYQRGDQTTWVQQKTVLVIIEGPWTEPSYYGPLLATHYQNTLKKLKGLISPDLTSVKKLREYSGQAYPYLKPAAKILVLGFLAFLGIKWLRKIVSGRAQSRTNQASESGHLQPHLTNLSDVEAFFLNIYREKLGAFPDDPAEIELIEVDASGSKRVVELKVRHEGVWRSRRMTLATIGDNTGSKSQCFYVIYDTHMVVKIPPAPISSFDDYLVRVQAEAKIMHKLAPKECVIPNVSVILKKIHTFPQADKLTADLLEREYIRWLRISPGYQRFLKVAGNFAFFMDLAKYYFLSRVAGGFHSAERFIDEELRADTDILTDVNQFENKYGTPGSKVWPDLHHAYKEFQRELSGAMAQADEHIDLSDWQIRNLFLSRIAGREPQIPALNVSDRFNTHLEIRLRKLGATQSETGLQYRNLLKNHTRSRLLNRNRKTMAAIVTNLLALLSWLAENHIAMRDLKPDNLLVAGNPQDYPQFLSSAQHYAIGLIDLETAVDYERGSHPAIIQPQLGGTPYYGTPSHFFPNQLLQDIHKNLPLVFHLQDWYAVVGIVYEVITGEILFQKTAREISRQMKTVMQTVAQKGDIKSAYIRFALQFWDCAAREFENKLQLHGQRLETISAGIPENTQQRLKDHIRAEQSRAEARIKQCLDSNAAFNKGDNRRRLEQSKARDLERLRAKYAGRKDSEKLLRQIDDLIGLKQQTENLAQMDKKLETHFPKIPVKTLLEMMFAVVHGNMRPDITEIPEEIPQVPAPGEESADALDETAQLDQTQVLGCSVTVEFK